MNNAFAAMILSRMRCKCVSRPAAKGLQPGSRGTLCCRVKSPVPCSRTVTVPWGLTWALGVKWSRPAASARGYQTATGPISSCSFYFWVVNCEGKRLQDKCLQNCFVFCYASRSFEVVLASAGLVCWVRYLSMCLLCSPTDVKDCKWNKAF